MGEALIPRWVRDDRYRVVANLLRQQSGTLLDVGARDRSLADGLDRQRLQYFSADIDGSHDFRIDLDAPLPFADRQFDVVVALDVLEHVEHIHAALHELARVARQSLLIALPNLSCLSKRWSFLRRGTLGTAKYSLGLVYSADRHRWLTTYGQMNAFVVVNGGRDGFRVCDCVGEPDGGPVGSRLLWAAVLLHLLPRSLAVRRCIYYLHRRDGHGDTASEARGGLRC